MAQHSQQVRPKRTLKVGGAALIAASLFTLGLGVAPAYADDAPPEETPIVEEVTTTEPTDEVVEEEVVSEETTPVPEEDVTEESAAQSFSTQAAKDDRELICTDITSGDGWQTKVDTPGDPATVEVTAPSGFLIDQYCVKAGTEPIIIDVVPPSATVIIDHPNKDSVSHYQIHLVPVEDPSVDPTGTVYAVCTLEGLELDWEGTAGDESVTFRATLDDDNDGTFDEQNAALTAAGESYLFSMLADPTVLTEGTVYSMQIFAGDELLEEKEFTVDCEEDTPPPPPPGEDPDPDPVGELANTGDETTIALALLALALGASGVLMLRKARRSSVVGDIVA